MPAAPLSVDTGHHAPIFDARLNFFGNRLATCSGDHLVKIFEVKESGMCQLAEVSGHTGPVWQVDWANPRFGTMFASAGYDCRAIVWKEAEVGWQKQYEYTGHGASVNTIAFAPERCGLIFASGSSDGTIAVHTYDHLNDKWESVKINEAHPQGVNSISWAPGVTLGKDGRTVEKRFVSCGNDKFLKIWVCNESGDWVLEKVNVSHNDFVRDVAWCPVVFSALHRIVSVGQDRRVVMWKCNNIGRDEWTFEQISKTSGALWHVNWSACGTFFSVSGEDNKNIFFREYANEWAEVKDEEEEFVEK
ncbi:unnamed protein product, partial [Mesorhabditis belari]|uniref:Protein SEC13 homolog n=1 Tax=Mesorhabditis belari TaxID=2138241 RepID=A0AAF3EU30_9BILA